MKSCIVYSSETGNTRTVAMALAERFQFPIYSVDAYPTREMLPTGSSTCEAWAAYDCLILGFWVLRGLPDPKMLAFMKACSRKDIFFFATHAAWADSDHVRKCKAAVTSLLEEGDNRVLGSFTCQGRVRLSSGSHHPMTSERKARLEEARLHPNAEDISNCQRALAEALHLPLQPAGRKQ